MAKMHLHDTISKCTLSGGTDLVNRQFHTICSTEVNEPMTGACQEPRTSKGIRM